MSKIQISYEWSIEYTDIYNDICDCDFDVSLVNLLIRKDLSQKHDICLVRDKFEEEDLIDRDWAYIIDGNLEETFTSGIKVPKRFLKEFQRNKHLLKD